MNQPELIIIGGPNGSGKSTFAARFLTASGKKYTPVNPDDIAREIDPANPEQAAVKAGMEALRRIRSLYDGRQDFLVETTLSGAFHLNLMEKAKAEGWDVNLHFIFVSSPETSLERISQRVSLGGHDVSREDVLRRYKKTFRNLFRMAGIVDRIYIFENGLDHLRPVATYAGNRWHVILSDVFDTLVGKYQDVE